MSEERPLRTLQGLHQNQAGVNEKDKYTSATHPLQCVSTKSLNYQQMTEEHVQDSSCS